MQIEFLESKDGSKTFSADGVFFHSSYSPVKEAQRFVQGCSFPINPKIIFFLEPGLSYCKEQLKEKYPDCLLVCIRFFDYKFDDENQWDSIIRFKELSQPALYFVENFGEEALLSSVFLIWKPAEGLFQKEINLFINEYKKALQNAKTLLVTRQFFEKKWLLNSCNFIKYGKNFIQADIKTQLPILVCASGPSLMPCLDIIKKERSKVFLLCLSSALSVLLTNDIKPDLILTTDGGYWAGQHLKALCKYPDLALAAPCEAFIPKTILKKNPILSLAYDDQSSFICKEIIEAAGLKSMQALRNPTVSGTGLFLAKSLTKNKIFFCGLDLAADKGFQHSQPNELEKNNSLFESRLISKEKRNNSSRFNSSSLEIYRSWFSSLTKDQVENVFRVMENQSNKALGNIKDISCQDFSKLLKQSQLEEKNQTKSFFSLKAESVNKCLQTIINKVPEEKWSHQIFPADYISIQNSSSQEENQAAINRLNKKLEELLNKIRKIADE